MKKRTTSSSALPRLTNEQLMELLAAEERAKHDPDTNRPDCFTCHSAVTVWATGFGDDHEDERVVEVRPCGHRATYSAEVAQMLAAQVRTQTATEATEPASGFFQRLTEISHLKDGWLDGQGRAPSWQVIKAASVLGPALPGDIVPHVYPTAPGGVQMEWEDEHGQHHLEVLPDLRLFLLSVDGEEEDEVRALRAEVTAARQFAEEMRTYCSPHGVAADYADRLLDHMDRAKEAGR